MQVLVDADACPKNVLKIIRQLQAEYRFRLITVASFNHLFDNPDHITVGNESQATDIEIINRIQAGDLLVTHDYGLAALALGKKALVIGINGRIYSDATIDFLLEERNLKSRLRRSGLKTKGPAARTETDDRRFRDNFLKLLSGTNEF
ncbi:MAG TPA: DUF188 domain-containing protein [Bacillota bacterium]|mgnify:CR=1 FL=1|nr:DUF188 domain-containing protein [Bacillota bacterium]HOL09095.1 DUF188 domain-containing protein [Bacillota bacterium]HPO98027.1 DUF188 domain-containing protein [Bacillota bacterium]